MRILNAAALLGALLFCALAHAELADRSKPVKVTADRCSNDDRKKVSPGVKFKDAELIGVPLIAAPTDDEAEYLASSNYQRVLGILTGNRRRLQPPIENFMAGLRPEERAAIGDFLAAAVIGGPERVHDGLSRLAEITGADEFMLVCDVFDPDLRLRSLDIAAAAMKA